MLKSISIVLLVLGLSVSAFADQGAVEGACKADREKLCKGLAPGQGLWKCMAEHQADLSDGCKKMIDQKKDEFLAHHPCAKDMKKFCKDVEKGEGRVIQCMKQHEAELSPECKAAHPHMAGDHPSASGK